MRYSCVCVYRQDKSQTEGKVLFGETEKQVTLLSVATSFSLVQILSPGNPLLQIVYLLLSFFSQSFSVLMSPWEQAKKLIGAIIPLEIL